MTSRKWQPPRPPVRYSQSSPSSRHPSSRGTYNSNYNGSYNGKYNNKYNSKYKGPNQSYNGYKPEPEQPAIPARPVEARVIKTARSWHKEQRRGFMIAVSLTLALGALLIGYGVQAQITAEATRTAQRAEQIALATKETLRAGPILFVPIYGNVCRQRWIDNATWTVRDGQDVVCDEAASWTVNTKPADQSVTMRMDAMRDGFRANKPGN